jgi:uncharacterized protein involved in exopolysaccharide biosynthesis
MPAGRSASRRHYLEAPLRRPGLVVAPAVVVPLAAAAFALLAPASYRAEAVLRAQWRDAGAESGRADMPDLLERRAAAVRQRLLGTPAPGVEVERLRSELGVTPLSPSSFAVAYRHRDPATAARVLNALATRASEAVAADAPVGALVGLELVAPATPPSAPDGPSPLWFGAGGVLLGLLLGLAAALVAEWRDRTVKGPEDLEEILPVPLLATLPELRVRERDE